VPAGHAQPLTQFNQAKGLDKTFNVYAHVLTHETKR